MVTRNALITVLVLLSSLGSTLLAQESDPAVLKSILGGLASEDPDARSTAATAAAELDAAALAPIGALLAEESPAVRAAARRALWGITTAACRPGRADRQAVTDALLDLVEGTAPKLAWPDRGLLLRMVGAAARDPGSARRLGALLEDERLWTYALFALERIPGDAADEALLECLEREVRWPPRAALVAVIGARGSRKGATALITLAARPRAPLAFRARRALALQGASLAEKVLTSASAAGLAGAGRDLITWCDRRRERGVVLETLRPFYVGLLGDEDAAVRVGALSGLAHLDGEDSGLLEMFVAALSDPASAVVRGAEGILMARRVSGTDVALLELFGATGDEPVRSRLLRIVARREAAGWEKLVLAEASDAASASRRDALELLGAVRDPEALKLLSALVVGEEDDLRDLAVQGLIPQGEHLALQGDADQARAVWLAALRATEDEGMAGEVLACLQRHPDAKILDAVDRFATAPSLRERVCALRLAVAEDLAESDPEGCRSLLERAFLASRSSSNRLAIAKRCKALGMDSSALLRAEGFVTDWMILGPFPASTEEGFTTNPFKPGGPEGEDVVIEGKGSFSWEPIRGASPDGTFDLTYLDPKENCEVYALAEVEWPEDAEVDLKLGSDDGVCVWVNGELVHRNWTWRGANMDDDTCTARLRKGRNHVVLKVLNGGGGWGFCLRIPPR